MKTDINLYYPCKEAIENLKNIFLKNLIIVQEIGLFFVYLSNLIYLSKQAGVSPFSYLFFNDNINFYVNDSFSQRVKGMFNRSSLDEKKMIEVYSSLVINKKEKDTIINNVITQVILDSVYSLIPDSNLYSYIKNISLAYSSFSISILDILPKIKITAKMFKKMNQERMKKIGCKKYSEFNSLLEKTVLMSICELLNNYFLMGSNIATNKQYDSCVKKYNKKYAIDGCMSKIESIIEKNETCECKESNESNEEEILLHSMILAHDYSKIRFSQIKDLSSDYNYFVSYKLNGVNSFVKVENGFVTECYTKGFNSINPAIIKKTSLENGFYNGELVNTSKDLALLNSELFSENLNPEDEIYFVSYKNIEIEVSGEELLATCEVLKKEQNKQKYSIDGITLRKDNGMLFYVK